MKYGIMFNGNLVVREDEKGNEEFISPKYKQWTKITRGYEDLGIGINANNICEESEALKVANKIGVSEEDFRK